MKAPAINRAVLLTKLHRPREAVNLYMGVLSHGP
jgi:hypothetical protein